MRQRALRIAIAFLCLASAPAADAQGFGRFGRINDDGLLTLNVTPTGLEFPANVDGFKVGFGDGSASVTAKVTHLDATEKRLTLSGGGDGAPTALCYTLLYPGMSATFGKRMVLRCPPEYGATHFGQSGFLLRKRNAVDALPLQIALRPGLPAPKEHVVVTDRGVQLVFESVSPLGEVRFITPLGSQPGKVSDTAVKREAARWGSIPVPTRTRSKATLSADGRRVTITEQFTDSSIAPLPPVLAFAIAHGYPAKVSGAIITTPALTKWGPFAYVKGNLLRYTLPIPPTEERGYVRPANVDPVRVALLNEFVGHLGGGWATNGVDLGYAGMTNAQMAVPYLSSAKRQEVAAAWKRYLPQTFRFPPYAAGAKQTWRVATELSTRQSYLWTYKIDGPGGYDYDLEWGNALPLYGLYKYAQYTGDWALVRQHWADVPRIYRYMELGEDWAWMTCVNADHGFSTGTGDPLCAAYAGTVACLKMARALGDKAAERFYAGRVAKMAVPMVARFWYTNYGRKVGLLGAQAMALGFNEQEGFTRSTYQESPWWPTTLLSGDGALPEVFTLYAAFGKDALRVSEQRYQAAYPSWYVGDYKYPYKPSYDGNGMYVTFPHIFGRALVLKEPTATLWKYIDGAKTNRNNAWIGPNVVAEVLSRDAPLLLTEWRPAAYLDGTTSADGKRVTLTFHLAEPSHWGFTSRIKPGYVPGSVTINGVPIPFLLSGGILTVSPRPVTAGALKVVVERK